MASVESAADALMARALALAARGRMSTHPNPRVGCLVVRDGEIVGEAYHVRAGEPHAEVLALRAAGTRARGAEVFVTLEPCAHHGRTPPCVDALLAAGVKRVWAALEDPDPRVSGRGLARLREAGVEVRVGVGRAAAEAENRGFLSRHRKQRPWFTLKLAASLDGRTAMASGESRWITGESARRDVHRRRAEAGAVLTSAATVLADDPRLDVRELETDDRAAVRQPDRIVLAGCQRLPPNARVWAPGARRLLLTAAAQDVPEGVEVLSLPADDAGHVELAAVARALAQREVNEVLIECGPRLAGVWLRSGLIDEWLLYLAPMLLGHEARPLALLPGIVTLEQALRFRLSEVTTLGEDLRLTLHPESRRT
ncbi:MAG: bifunctional diaminohydroxyphosphoribosylaminopyrimidine deaminase/5-amino-6-(5-phosphoribosylamino)uracil reductase RibD [Sinobacteraceae bacterium]|nr:bifunctional diaminohydroxyphosphoribosylaminopyrimidine deaminase/5-amino-6-(5-phosphoribosylamino)uracil reductase RibD [Nevskiaceae bacterium]